MRISVHASMALLELVLDREYPELYRSVESRLEHLDYGMDLLDEHFQRLKVLEVSLRGEYPRVEDWPGLSEDFAALLTWLMQDLKNSWSSEEIDVSVKRATTELLSEWFDHSYPPDLFFKIHHWAVGSCWSHENRTSSLNFPLRALEMSKDEAAVAYQGLVNLLHFLESEDIDIGQDTGFESEMALSGVPIRVLGLAEALNPHVEDNARKAFEFQIKKLGGDSNSETKRQHKRLWPDDKTNAFLNERNSVAHVSAQMGLEFSQIVARLNRHRAHELGSLASTLMAAEILFKLDNFSPTKVEQWVKQVNKQLDGERPLTPRPYHKSPSSPPKS